MDFDLAAMVELFGEPHVRHSHPERGNYWFEYLRNDGAVVRVVVDVVERRVVIGVDGAGGPGSSFQLENCDTLRVLEMGRRTMESVSAQYSIRCFIALDAETVMAVEAPYVPG